MGKLNFTRDAGKRLLDIDAAPRQQVEQAIAEQIGAYELEVDNLQVEFDASLRQITLSGCAPDNLTREKIILCAGNIEGIAAVNDRLQVAEDESTRIDWYTVKPGDTLQALSKFFLRDYQKYMEIVHANEPMLLSPTQIYPGQMLRIPPEPRRCVETTIVRRKSVIPKATEPAC